MPSFSERIVGQKVRLEKRLKVVRDSRDNIRKMLATERRRNRRAQEVVKEALAKIAKLKDEVEDLEAETVEADKQLAELLQEKAALEERLAHAYR